MAHCSLLSPRGPIDERPVEARRLPELLGAALRIFVRAVFGWIRERVRARVGPLAVHEVHPGAVTFVQRFGDALDLNPHFHTLVLDGAYVVRGDRAQLVQIDPPSDEDVARVTEQVAQRIVRMLQRRGKLELDAPAAIEDDGSVLLPCMEASGRRVGAVGREAGRALRRPGRRAHVQLAALPKRRCAEVDGFSLHADVCVPARDRAQLKRLVRYVARPAIASERLELLADGRVRYRFQRAWRDGSVAVEYDPVYFIGKLRGTGAATARELGALSRMSRAPREHPRARRQRRSRAAERDGVGDDRQGSVVAVRRVARGAQLRPRATALSLGRADAARVRDRRARVPELRRSHEADRRDHRPSDRAAHARARRAARRSVGPVAGPRSARAGSARAGSTTIKGGRTTRPSPRLPTRGDPLGDRGGDRASRARACACRPAGRCTRRHNVRACRS